jgi:LPS-assembly protein
MKFWRLIKIILLSAFLAFFATNSFAIASFGEKKSSSGNAILKADQIDGDRTNNTLIATGNVEVLKESSIIYADKVIYHQDEKIINGVGNIKVKNIEIGNMLASEVKMKDDFSSGEFFNSTIVMKDGSYLKSPRIERISPEETTLHKSFYSLCPNDKIANDNESAGKKRDMAAISSSSTTIDRKNNMMHSTNGVFRFYNVPFLYTPYIAIPLPAKKRKSGFLYPSYVKTTNFGFGIRVPYYFDIAPNMDLKTTPQISLTSDQFIVANEFRHLTSYGEYNLNLEFANNKLKLNQVNASVLNANNSGLSERTNKDLRWNLTGKGLFDFTENAGLDFDINTVSDISYLRDYQFSFLAYTQSKVNVDYIKKRDYYSVKAVKFQELQNRKDANQAQIVVPIIDTYTESEKSFFSKEKFALATNISSINPEDGLQYRRASATPEIKIPFNINGNLFDLNAKLQGDVYWLENNFKTGQATNNFDSTFINYKPETSLTWRLPLIQKSKYNRLILEPIASLVSSSYKRNGDKTVNQDSNDAELSVSNLFISDRISGFDRNESGERFSYGVKSSLFNDLGEFGLTVGQSYRISNAKQDVEISGFAENNKSNLVGQALYKATKYFSIFYTFQLNENNYRNDINQVSTDLKFDRFSLSSDYLLLRRSQQNLLKVEQLTLRSSLKLADKWFATILLNRDLELKRTISRSIALKRDGCCTIFGLTVTETNPGSLIKPQRSFSINFTFKNL